MRPQTTLKRANYLTAKTWGILWLSRGKYNYTIYIYLCIHLYIDLYIYIYTWIYVDLYGIYVVKLNQHVYVTSKLPRRDLACGVLMPETSPICNFRRPRSSCKGSNCSCSWTSNLATAGTELFKGTLLEPTVSQKPTKLF